MNKKIVLKLSAKLLGMASDQFCNHGCNDLFEDFWEGVSLEEKKELYKEYHDWNGDPEDFDENQLGYLGDSALMHYFSEMITKL